MSRKKGTLVTCDRCGCWDFKEYKGIDSQNISYTPPQNYSDAPSGWESIARVGDVCPRCAQEYSDMLVKFKYKPAHAQVEQANEAGDE